MNIRVFLRQLSRRTGMLRGYSIRTNCDTNIRQSESPPPPRVQLLCRSCSNKHTHSLSNRRDARKHGAGAQRSGERSAARPWQPCALSPRQQCLQTKALKKKDESRRPTPSQCEQPLLRAACEPWRPPTVHCSTLPPLHTRPHPLPGVLQIGSGGRRHAIGAGCTPGNASN